MNNKLLQPSGLNNQFYGEGLPFSDYIALMKNIILESRYDLTSETADLILNANSPYILDPIMPTTLENSNQIGFLLIHGLFESPFFLSDVGQYLATKNFITYSILLPGHGTIPGDLLHVDYREWIKAVNYGIQCLSQRVKNIFVLGFSLGGTLAIHHALQQNQCKGLVLFAPALKTRSLLSYVVAKNHRWFSWLHQKSKWYHIAEQVSFAKYDSYAFNAGYQACRLMVETKKLLTKAPVDIPIFTITTRDDETVSNQAILKFFHQHKNPKSKLLYYSPQKYTVFDERVLVCNSNFPERNILDFSHICLPISPENPYFGANSSYRDFTHYPGNFQPPHENCFQGAVSRKNLKQHLLQRLTYNPDFSNMLVQLEQFLQRVLA